MIDHVRKPGLFFEEKSGISSIIVSTTICRTVSLSFVNAGQAPGSIKLLNDDNNIALLFACSCRAIELYLLHPLGSNQETKKNYYHFLYFVK